MAWLGAVGMAWACGHPKDDTDRSSADAADAAQSHCPDGPVASSIAPGTASRHRTLQTWLDGLDAEVADKVLITPADLADMNERFGELPGAWRDPSAQGVGVPEAVDAAIVDRMRYMKGQLAGGQFVEGAAGALADADDVIRTATVVDHQRLVVGESQLYCVPTRDGLFRRPAHGAPDRAFDRNACASLHPGERIRVLRRSSDGHWLHVHAGHTLGWLHDASLTPRLSRTQLDQWTSGRFVVPLSDEVQRADGVPVRVGTRLPVVGETDAAFEVLAPDPEQGLKQSTVPRAGVAVGPVPLTRRAVFEIAFSLLGKPYGWGGLDGHRDCSRYLRDVLATFGIELGRHSGVQARQGTYTVDLSSMSEPQKRAEIDRRAGQGIVLLYMPGHIMLLLGRDGDHHYAISSISEWLEPCPRGPDTVHRIDKVDVTTLELGRGTERTAFIERLSRLVVFSTPTPPNHAHG